jgi:hypothetical protein
MDIRLDWIANRLIVSIVNKGFFKSGEAFEIGWNISEGL